MAKVVVSNNAPSVLPWSQSPLVWCAPLQTRAGVLTQWRGVELTLVLGVLLLGVVLGVLLGVVLGIRRGGLLREGGHFFSFPAKIARGMALSRNSVQIIQIWIYVSILGPRVGP